MIIRKIFISGLLLLPLCLLIFLNTHAAAQSSTNYTMAADIMDVEGGEKTSTNYTLIDSMGQGIEGGGTASTNYILYAGFNGFAGEGIPNEYFVDCVNGDNNNDGLSWASAKATITNAITELDERPGTIYVAQGNYQENITLTSGLTLLGGYDASTEERDINKYLTTIDGAYNGFSVVTGAKDATIDGFTITQGLATAGGGINCDNITNFTIRNNTIENNYSIEKGAGVFIYNNSTVLIENNSIIGNHAERYTGGSGFLSDTKFVGGGIYVGNNSHPTITGNIIRENTCDEFGGGIYVEEDSNPIISGNYIEKNEALGDSGNGGGIYITDNCDPSLINNMITENVAYSGGGIYIADQSQVSVVNNTIAGNVATSVGGGIYIYSSPNTDIKNSILWANSDNIFGITCDKISFSDIADCEGNGNISCDPEFVGGDPFDYHLKYVDVPCCRGAGTCDEAPTDDIDGDCRCDECEPFENSCDIGADEYSSITVTSPAAGESCVIGTPETIEWTSSGITGNVKIELGRLSGCEYSFSPIAEEVPVSDESYEWTVSGPKQNLCVIKITSSKNENNYGLSEAFRIVE